MLSFIDYFVSDEVVLYCITYNFYIEAAEFHICMSHAFPSTCQLLGRCIIFFPHCLVISERSRSLATR